MLKKLIVENIALVDRTELQFDSGLSALTGETGAGKSVIVTALSLALGGRAEKEFIRHGADSATVTAFFTDESGSNTEVKRTITRNGAGRVTINGEKVTIALLKETISPLAEIIGQHANQMLMDEDNHLFFLDRFAGLEAVRVRVSELFDIWKTTQDRLKKTRNKREQLIQERELLLFQQQEIQRACISPGEEQDLIAERKRLDSARTMMQAAGNITSLLDNDEASVLPLLAQVRREFETMSSVDPDLEQKASEIDGAKYALEDIRAFIEQYGASIVDDPKRIEEINLRLDELYNLKKKYGGSEESILKTLSLIDDKLADRHDVDSIIDKLERDTERLSGQYTKVALDLSKKRTKSAAKIEKLVTKELAELAIENGGFKFDFTYEDDAEGVVINGRAVRPFAHGLEGGRILFSANPGEPLKSLVKTASGGEISRVLLAMKSAEMSGRSSGQSLMVFDEVDAGIGGRTAIEVANKLKKLSANGQLIVVTHLHQIARVADHHFVAEKRSDRSKRTVINVRRLDKADLKPELDRMIALPEED